MLGERRRIGRRNIGGLQVGGGEAQRDHDDHRDADADKDCLEALRQLAAELVGIAGGRRVALRVLRGVLSGTAGGLQIIRFCIAFAGGALVARLALGGTQ